jgi:hypothetical protein
MAHQAARRQQARCVQYWLWSSDFGKLESAVYRSSLIDDAEHERRLFQILSAVLMFRGDPQRIRVASWRADRPELNSVRLSAIVLIAESDSTSPGVGRVVDIDHPERPRLRLDQLTEMAVYDLRLRWGQVGEVVRRRRADADRG